MHVRPGRITADPLLLDDAVRYIDAEGRLPAGSQPGNLGISLQVNPELGVAIVARADLSGQHPQPGLAHLGPKRPRAPPATCGNAAGPTRWCCWTRWKRPTRACSTRCSRCWTTGA